MQQPLSSLFDHFILPVRDRP